MTFPSSLSHNVLGSSLEITVKYLLCSELWKIQLILKIPMPRKQLESWVFFIDETALNTGNSGSVQNRLLPFFYFSFFHWLKKNSSQKTVFFEIGKSLFHHSDYLVEIWLRWGIETSMFLQGTVFVTNL